MKLILQIVATLLLIGNLFGAFTLHFRNAVFLQKFNIPANAIFWFKWLPLINTIGLVGLLFLKKWAIPILVLGGICTILVDLIFKINYHLPIAIFSFLVLLILIYKNYSLFE
jgi:hypothetical protein